jgi:hypothetical protein
VALQRPSSSSDLAVRLVTVVPLLSLFIILLMVNGVYAQDELRDKDVSRPSGSTENPTCPSSGRSTEAQEGFGSKEEPVFKSFPSKSEYTIIPLPAFSFNRNESYWFGALVAILKTNPMGTGQVFLLTIQLVVKVSP